MWFACVPSKAKPVFISIFDNFPRMILSNWPCQCYLKWQWLNVMALQILVFILFFHVSESRFRLDDIRKMELNMGFILWMRLAREPFALWLFSITKFCFSSAWNLNTTDNGNTGVSHLLPQHHFFCDGAEDLKECKITFLRESLDCEWCVNA